MKRRKGFGYAKYGYLFSIPFVLVFLIFSLYPTIFTALLGFTDSKGLGNTNFHFLQQPFQNFVTILNNKSFQTSLQNTVEIWLMNFVPQILLALLLTEWFTNTSMKIKGQGLFKVAYYLPNIITAATVAILFNSLFGYPMGPVNDIFKSLGLAQQPINFLVSKATAKGVVAFIQFWMWYGYTMIILISGVLGINPEMFEAANIDGANRAQVFFRITLPNLKTILLYTLITSMIGGLQMFDIPRLFLWGGPDNATLTTSLFIYNQAFSGSYLYSRASAASMLMFIIIAMGSAVIFFLMRDKDEIRQKRAERQLIKQAKREMRGQSA